MNDTRQLSLSFDAPKEEKREPPHAIPAMYYGPPDSVFPLPPPLLRLRFDTMPPSATAQQKGAFVRNGRVHFFTKKRIQQQENNMVALVHSALPAGWKPLEGPLYLRIHLCYPYRKNEKKQIVKSGAEIVHDRRPDLDNLLKGCIDAFVTAAIMLDDGQVSDLIATKRRGPQPYWTVDVGKLPLVELSGGTGMLGDLPPPPNAKD